MKYISIILIICTIIYPSLQSLQCERDFYKTTFHNGITEFNVLLMWFPTTPGYQNVLNLCSSETGLPIKRHCTYSRAGNNATWEETSRNMKLLNCSYIQKECMEEPFEHMYIKKNDVKVPFQNKWETAQLMERGNLQYPCLLNTGLPITRRCQFNANAMKAEWELLSPDMRNVSCVNETQQEVVTDKLNNLYVKAKTDQIEAKQIIKNVTELLTKNETVRLPADIQLSSEILKLTTNNKDPELVKDVLKVVDIVMGSKPQAVIQSAKVNAPSTLLKTIDKYFNSIAKLMVPTDNCSNIPNGVVYETLKHCSVFYINPSCSNISGLAIYESNRKEVQHQRYDDHTRNYYRFININETIDQIVSEPDLYLATYFPLSLWNKLKIETNAVDDYTVFTFFLYKNDLLFVNNTRMDYKPAKRVLGISIPDYSGELPEDVPFILNYRKNPSTSHELPICGYWNDHTWITDGITTNYKNIADNNLLICHSRHLTNFCDLLGLSSSFQFSLGEIILLDISHDQMLDYISILGCGLSLFGLFCIWLTAVCFKNWRAQKANKVLLNMCFVLTLLMLFFLLLNFPQVWDTYVNLENDIHCMAMGAFLHYIVLVLFFWMFFIAILQYQRYVVVMGYKRPSNFITKFAIIAWGVPLIPTALVAILEPYTYTPDKERIENKSAICYPTGNSLIYGVLLPIAAIVVANLCLFIYIFYAIHKSLRDNPSRFQQNADKKRLMIQVRVSIMLFFLLGISWVFGFLSYIDKMPIFSYIFCLLATLQGFVLFLYSIVIDKSARSSWTLLFCGKDYKTMEDTNIVQMLNSRRNQ